MKSVSGLRILNFLKHSLFVDQIKSRNGDFSGDWSPQEAVPSSLAQFVEEKIFFTDPPLRFV